MSFQAYLDTIKAKTGKTPQDFLKLAREKGLLEEGVKVSQITDWLKKDFDLGHGHAMALIVTFNTAIKPERTNEERIADHFTGKKDHWRKSYDELIRKVETFGDDVDIYSGDSYISLQRNGKKFAVIYTTGGRIDIGIKRKGVPVTDRFQSAGSWNAMVTHRVRIIDSQQLDNELLDWLKQAYESAK